MSGNGEEYTQFSQEYITNTITQYFNKLSSKPESRPTNKEIILMVYDILFEFANGTAEEKQHSFDIIAKSFIENDEMVLQLRDIMFMLRQLNNSYQNLSEKHEELLHKYAALQEEHEALMEEYLS